MSAGNKMFPGFEVMRILASADVSLSINHLATVEIECEALSGDRHGIKGGWRSRRGRSGWALGFAVTFPKERSEASMCCIKRTWISSAGTSLSRMRASESPGASSAAGVVVGSAVSE